MESSEPIMKHFLSELDKISQLNIFSDPAAVRGDTPNTCTSGPSLLSPPPLSNNAFPCHHS